MLRAFPQGLKPVYGAGFRSELKPRPPQSNLFSASRDRALTKTGVLTLSLTAGKSGYLRRG
jgi:hypothetical protein